MSSQGYCLRCVAMWIGGVDPHEMMVKAAELKRAPKYRNALQMIAAYDASLAYDPEMWDSKEDYWRSAVVQLQEIAMKGLSPLA